VEERAERADPERGDERRRYYRMTPLGLSVVRAEARRLDALVRAARRKKLIGESLHERRTHLSPAAARLPAGFSSRVRTRDDAAVSGPVPGERCANFGFWARVLYDVARSAPVLRVQAWHSRGQRTLELLR